MSEKNVSVYLSDKDQDLIDYLNNHPEFNSSKFFRESLRNRIYKKKPSSGLMLNMMMCYCLSLALIIGSWGISFINDFIRLGMLLMGITVAVGTSFVFLKDRRCTV